VPYYTTVPAIGNYVNVLPFATTAVVAAAAIDTTPGVISDLYGVLSSMFCFVRGGIRLKYIENITSTQNQSFVSYIEQLPIGTTVGISPVFVTTTSYTGVTNYSQRTSSPQVYHNGKNNLASEIQVPQYHKFHSRVCSEHLATGSILATYNFTRQSLATRINVVHHYPDGANACVVARAASDDTNFGVFISVPTMVISPGVGTQ